QSEERLATLPADPPRLRPPRSLDAGDVAWLRFTQASSALPRRVHVPLQPADLDEPRAALRPTPHRCSSPPADHLSAHHRQTTTGCGCLREADTQQKLICIVSPHSFFRATLEPTAE